MIHVGLNMTLRGLHKCNWLSIKYNWWGLIMVGWSLLICGRQLRMVEGLIQIMKQSILLVWDPNKLGWD